MPLDIDEELFIALVVVRGSAQPHTQNTVCVCVWGFV